VTARASDLDRAMLAHSPARYAELGRLGAGAGPTLTRGGLEAYGRLLAQARTVPASIPTKSTAYDSQRNRMGF
jgi:hypothetical protein